MSTAKNILSIVPGLQATAIVSENLKLVKKIGSNKPKYLAKSGKDITKVGIKNFVGIGLIKPTVEMIGSLD